MTTRLDLVLQKHPDRDEEIRSLASRDPSGNNKYLDWSVKILVSGQALAPEISDVVEMFHRHRSVRYVRPAPGVRQTPGSVIRSDLYSYRSQDFAKLRDQLLKIKRAQDRKRKKRERLYRIEGAVEADVVYDSPDLVVRHIKNKQASVHHGLGTKWCISMLREGYFEDYQTNNATFFFFERKHLINDEFDKMALMIPRSSNSYLEVLTSSDRRVDMMVLAKVHGLRVFDIFREIYERSERYPCSIMSSIYSGNATREQLETVFADLSNGSLKLRPYEIDSIIESLCCNDAAPESLLLEIMRCAPALSETYLKRSQRHRSFRTNELTRTVLSALAIHPSLSNGAREKIINNLRRRRVNIADIHRTVHGGHIGVNSLRRHRRLRRLRTAPSMRAQAHRLEHLAATWRKRAAKVEKKLKLKKRKRNTA